MAARERFLSELGRLRAPCDEHAGPTHVTASGIVVGRRGTVLHRHKRLGIWMQPGGHIDAGETPDEAARARGHRRARPGGRASRRRGRCCIHLDVHEAAHGHTHLDLRYLLLGADDDPQPPPDESPDARWCSWDEALADGRPRADRRPAPGPGRLRGDGVTRRPRAPARRPGPRHLHHAAPAPARGAGRDRRASPRWRRSWPRSRPSGPTPRRGAAVLTATQKELEEQIAGISERRSVIEKRMYAATSSSGRDLQAMNDEVRHLTDRRAELEELELVAMLDQDPIDAELAALHERAAPLEAQAEELRRQVAEGQAEIDAALGEAVGARAAEAALLPTALADRYETLRARLKGTGAARLVGSHCDGCHLELSSVEVEKIRALPPGEVATCEQCGRILVPDLTRSAAPC